uniref:TELO2 interacting protein 2 n=1 Tax=Ornithorhynchus anatinus TaxID=9258 RepID=A0A6I8N2L1_ORNAN
MHPFQWCNGCFCGLGLVAANRSCAMPPISFQDLPLNIYMVIFGTGIFVFVLSLIFCCYFIRSCSKEMPGSSIYTGRPAPSAWKTSREKTSWACCLANTPSIGRTRFPPEGPSRRGAPRASRTRGMELASGLESLRLEGAPSASGAAAPARALARILRRLAPRGDRPGTPGDAAVKDLRALLQGTDGRRLFEGPDEPLRALKEVARALCGHAVPPRDEPDAGAGGPRPGDAAERAAEVGSAFLLLLGKLETARGALKPGTAERALSELAGPVYVFAVTHGPERPWTGPGSRTTSREVLALLLRVAGCGSVAEFLRGGDGDGEGNFSGVLGLLKPELNKECWKRNPATRHVFSWTLRQVTRPWLSRYLEKVLPPALLMSDDYQTENKILGVDCLHHIILNVPAADLRQYNRDQVVYHALFNHLYTPEPSLIQATLRCLLALLPVVEGPLRWQAAAPGPRSHSPTDDVLRLVLTHMEPERRLLLRRVYAGSLPAFVESLGILTARHLKRLERVVVSYLEVYDGPEEEARLAILETLKVTIRHAWPRVPRRLDVLLKALLKMVCDVARDRSLTPEPVKAALLEEATGCLILLDRCCGGRVKDLLAPLLHSCEDGKVRDCVRKVRDADGPPPDGTERDAV